MPQSGHLLLRVITVQIFLSMCYFKCIKGCFSGANSGKWKQVVFVCC